MRGPTATRTPGRTSTAGPHRHFPRTSPALPPDPAALAVRAGREAGFDFAPDLCIVNWYGPSSRMGLHQDKDESRDSIAAGAPVVSVSIGDTARFLFGGLRRKDPVEKILLESG